MSRFRNRPSRYILAAGLGLATVAGTGALTSVARVASAATATDTVTAIPHLTGANTSVTLDAATMAALKSLHVAVGTTGTAALNATTGSVSFPITSGYAEIHSNHSFKPGYVVGSIEHTGSGLTFTGAGKTLTVTNFVIDPGNSMLYATVNGTTQDFPLFFLDGAALKISMSGGAVHLDGTVVKLTPQAATALDSTFGTTAVKPYTEVGIAHITAQGTANTYTGKVAQIPRLTGVSTSVQFNSTALGALKTLGVAPSAFGSATLNGTTGTITFPITGGSAVIHSDHAYKPGYVAGVVIHQGSGLTLTKGATKVTLSNFTIDPGNSTVTGLVNGAGQGTQLFVADGAHLQITTPGGTVHLDGTQLLLTPGAATALNKAFGTTAFKGGFDMGTVHIIVK